MEAGWRQQETRPEPQITIGSWRWRDIIENNQKLDRGMKRLLLGQQQLQRAMLELELREAVAAAEGRNRAGAPMPGAAPRNQGLELTSFSPRRSSEQGSVSSEPTAQTSAAARVAQRNAALGAEPQPEPP